MYHVNFYGQHNFDLDGEYDLGTILEICKDNDVRAELWDEQGFRKGWAYPDGNYTLC